VEYRALTRPISPVVAELLVREMRRRGGTGKVQRLGASTTWHNRSLELHIDPAGSGTTLALRQAMGAPARIRAVAATLAFTGFLLATLVPLFVEVLSGAAEEVIPFFVLMTIGSGLFWGRSLAHALHRRKREKVTAELARTIARLDAVAQANEGLSEVQLRALEPAPS
jgi:hypothetical protein